VKGHPARAAADIQRASAANEAHRLSLRLRPLGERREIAACVGRPDIDVSVIALHDLERRSAVEEGPHLLAERIFV
jgi:hypothetical protein